MSRPESVLIIGDSLTLGALQVGPEGVVSYVREPYVALVRAGLPDMRIDVDAAVHRTTSQALAAMEELLARFRPDVALLVVGGNDADIDWRRFIVSGGRSVRHRVSVTQYAGNLRELAAMASLHGAVAVLTDTPCPNVAIQGRHLSAMLNRDVTALMHAAGGQAECERRWERYQQAARQVAAETGAPLAPYGAVLHEHAAKDVFGTDGVHPNALGHRIIAATVLPAIEGIRQGLEQPAVPSATDPS
jgi:lysophospholipase L1-like esterase